MRAKKHFGQNFLQDTAVIDRIVTAFAPRNNQTIIEIGPGQGALTVALFDSIPTLTVIEIDRDLIPMLIARCETRGHLHVIESDVLRVDFTTLTQGKRIRLIGNLPYNIATPLLFKLLAQSDIIEDMHFMLQKEVVDRMVAQPGSKTYGRLSVIIQYYCQASLITNVPPEAFKPIPKVDSAVVRLVPHSVRALNLHDEVMFSQIIKAAFSQRRKTVRNTLKTYLSPLDWQLLDIDASRRAETLSLAEYIAIAKHYRSTHGDLCNR
jgi:16S rRNA (adenine1518-N6/adenine1519-N6)-dimethyltransferase